MYNPHIITQEFEKEVAKYCNAPYFVALDNCSNALFLALKYNNIEGKTIKCPNRTYVSVPMEIIHAGGKVEFIKSSGTTLKGYYYLPPTNVIDSSLLFTADMYVPETFMCLSFTGAYKTLKLGKGGGILLDDEKAYNWMKKARFSGRHEMSYHVDNFDDNPVIGWNFYMPIETAARGLQSMLQFYDLDGNKKINEPVELPYPELDKFKIFK